MADLDSVRDYVFYLRSPKFQDDLWGQHVSQKTRQSYWISRWAKLVDEGEIEKNRIESGYYSENDMKCGALEEKLKKINPSKFVCESEISDNIMKEAEKWKDYVYKREYGKYLVRIFEEYESIRRSNSRGRTQGTSSSGRSAGDSLSSDDINFLRDINYRREIRAHNGDDLREVMRLYRQRSRFYHPDTGGSNLAFQEYARRYHTFRDRHFPGMSCLFRY
jgi:hypothetical protein